MPSSSAETQKPAFAVFGRLRAGVAARRLALAAVMLAGATGLAAAIAPWLFSPTALVDAIATQLQNSSGLYVATRGRTSFALLPRPSIAIEGVAFADRNGALVIDADRLRGDVRLLPLLAGRLDVAAVTLNRPRVTVDLDKKPIDAPGVAARAAAARPATPEAAAADKAPFGVVAFVDGAALIVYQGRPYELKKIDATFEWRRIGEAAALTGAFDYRGERLEAMLWLARPSALLRGEQSVAAASLDGESLRFEAQGIAQLGANARFSGRVAATTPFVRQALRLLDVAAPLPGPFGDAQFSAQATLGLRDAQFRDARIFVDGNEFQGELSFRKDDGRPSLTAALKSEFVSLKPLLADAPALVASDGQWSKDAFELPDLSGADVDLRLAVAHARLGRLKVDDAALALTLRDGTLDLAMTQAQAYGGALKLHATFAPGATGFAVRANAQTLRLEAGALLWDAYGKPGVAGALDSSIAIDAAGEHMAALMRSLNGHASLALSDGEISGVDLERALRRLEKRPLSSAFDIRSGRSPFEKATATIKIEEGMAEIADGAARGPGFALAFEGAARLAERSLAIKAVAQEADGAGMLKEKGMNISFDLAGAWDDLTLKPDAQSFIRRSGAAAPLLPPQAEP